MKKRNEKGFTLIELLVVVAIIGILAAIAIPQFSAYRQRAYEAGSKSDLRNAANGEEAYFVDNDQYADCEAVGSDDTDCNNLPGFKTPSDSVTIKMTAAGGTTTPTFTGTGTASKGATGNKVCWNSENGGFVDCPSS
jgi:type IV pilus assembly protein PilA